MLQAVEVDQAGSLPPGSKTGVEVTGAVAAAVHWLTGTVLPDGDSGVVDVDRVLGFLADDLGESVELLDRGAMGYSEGFRVGPVRVMSSESRPDMGVLVLMDGECCEELGLGRIAAVHSGLGLRVSRLDLAFDGVPFTPEMVRDAWRGDQVRTRAKVPRDARPDRQWRTSDWRENAQGDTFSMGSRTSSQFARVYDRRDTGTRFELELKGETAAVAAAGLLALVNVGESERFGAEAVGWVRRFVDFVDPTSDTNVSRQTLLPWWESFICGAEKAQVSLGAAVTRTVEETRQWVIRQVGPALGLLLAALGADELVQIADQGKQRWRGRHRAALRAFGPAAATAAM